jgi:hypothetical protein
MSGYIEVCYKEKIACPIKFNYKWTGLSEFYTLYENIYHKVYTGRKELYLAQEHTVHVTSLEISKQELLWLSNRFVLICRYRYHIIL